MAWIGALIAVGGSLLGGSMADEGAKRARADEMALRGRELRLAEAQDARAQQLFSEYQTTYLPRERELVEAAFSDETSPEAAAARATTDVRASSQRGREIQLRDARRLGINPTSGAYSAMDNDRSLRDTALEVTARDTARRGARQENFQRQYSALQLGRNLPSTAGALTSSAMHGIGGLADAAGRRTDQANALAADAGTAIGESLSNLALAYGSRRGTSYSTGYGSPETVHLSDAGDITVRQPVLIED
jgi:hypothetical protein